MVMVTAVVGTLNTPQSERQPVSPAGVGGCGERRNGGQSEDRYDRGRNDCMDWVAGCEAHPVAGTPRCCWRRLRRHTL